MAIKFYCDEHIHPAISTALRNRGADILTAQDVPMLGVADDSHLQFAASQRRAVITQDTDFFACTKKDSLTLESFLPPSSKTLSEIIHSPIRVYQMKTEKEMENHIEFL